MAQKVEVLLLDDIDGSPAEESIRFAFDGVQYEIDLNVEHATAFRAAVQGYIDAARRHPGGKTIPGVSTSRRRSRAAEGKQAQVRKWARENGRVVNDRGRIPQNLVDEYEAQAAATDSPLDT